MGQEKAGVVYLIQCEDFVKIGCCELGGFEKRLKSLDFANPFPLKNLKTLECEFYRKQEMRFLEMHKQFRTKGEWFRLPQHLIEDLSWFEPFDFQPKQADTLEEKVNVRISESERQILDDYCEQVQRTQSDVVREFIRSLKKTAKKNPKS